MKKLGRLILIGGVVGAGFGLLQATGVLDLISNINSSYHSSHQELVTEQQFHHNLIWYPIWGGFLGCVLLPIGLMRFRKRQGG